MHAVDLAIQNGVDLDGTPIPKKMLDLYNKIYFSLRPSHPESINN